MSYANASFLDLRHLWSVSCDAVVAAVELDGDGWTNLSSLMELVDVCLFGTVALAVDLSGHRYYSCTNDEQKLEVLVVLVQPYDEDDDDDFDSYRHLCRLALYLCSCVVIEFVF